MMYGVSPWASLMEQPEPTPTSPQCEVFYRLKTVAETGGEVLDTAQLRAGGLIGEVVGESFVSFHYSLTPGQSTSVTFTIDSPLVVRIVAHDFRDWGTRRSRCERCGAWGHWDMQQGRYME